MERLRADLDGGAVRADGSVIDKTGRSTGLCVTPGGYRIVDAEGQTVGTLTMIGRIYNSAGQLVAQVERRDIDGQPYAGWAPNDPEDSELFALTAKLPKPRTPQRRR